MTNYTKKTVHGTFVMFVFLIASAILAYAFRLILARNLSLHDFGLFFSIVAFFGFLSIFRDLGLSQSLYYFIPRFLSRNQHGKVRAIITKILKVEVLSTFIISLLLILFSNFLLTNYFHAGPLQTLFYIFIIGFFFNSIESVFQTMFNGFQNQFLFSLHNFSRNLIVFILTLLGFQLIVTNIYIPVVAYLITYILLLVIFSIVFFRRVFPKFFSTKAEPLGMKPLLLFGISATLSNLGFLLMTYSDTLILTYFRTLEEVALYSAAVPIITLMLYIPFSISGVILPLSSELWEKKKKDSLRLAVEKMTKYVFVMLIPIAGVLIAYPEITLSILFGSMFVSASPVLTILAIAAVFYGVGYLYSNFLFSISGPKLNIYLSFSIAVLNLILNFILVPKYGIIGAAISTGVSYCILFIFSSIFLHRLVKMHFEFVKYLLTFISGGIFVGAIYYLKDIIVLNMYIEAAIVIILSFAVYITCIFLFKIVTIKELVEMKNQVFKK